jgi:uncharacterized delta-60 repeat protein
LTNVGQPTNSGIDEGRWVLVQSDGKVLVGATTQTGDGVVAVLLRYQTDGSPDSSFGDGGQVVTSVRINPVDGGLQLQSDGKIIVTGLNTIARFNSDGSPDLSYGSAGLASLDDVWFTGAAVDADGSLLVLGFGGSGGALEHVYRFTTDGSLDPGFGQAGVSENLPIGSRSIAVSSDGKIVVAGVVGQHDTQLRQFAVVRFSSDGTLDHTFSNDGLATAGIAGEDNEAVAVAIQSDGAILVGGWHRPPTIPFDPTPNPFHFEIIRFDVHGGLDASFDGDGIQASTMTGDQSAVSKLLVLEDGRIIAGGFGGFAVLNSDGSIADESWTGLSDVAVQQDGKLLAVATYYSKDIWLARMVLPEGQSPGQHNAVFEELTAQQNPTNPLDIDGDDRVTPQDLLQIIDSLNGVGSATQTVASAAGAERSSVTLDVTLREGQAADSSTLSGSAAPSENLAAVAATVAYLDSSGDGFVSPLDALLVIDRLNRPQLAERPSEMLPIVLTHDADARVAAIDQILAGLSAAAVTDALGSDWLTSSLKLRTATRLRV